MPIVATSQLPRNIQSLSLLCDFLVDYPGELQEQADKHAAEFKKMLSITGIVNHVMVANTQQLADKLGSASQPTQDHTSTCSQAGGHQQLSRVGGLVLAWLISQFQGALRRNEKTSCTSTLTRFIAHLA
ncbi:hypothetical protein BKA83DRAFT_4120748 [Pisolithus microcarpus]|nr:hypothetical protein BKA83DRAFT_4120748 [Pisolithus microcarpus]